MIDDVFTGIKALIVALNSDIYPDSSVINQSLQNNQVTDYLTQYVTMTELEMTESKSCLPYYDYDVEHGRNIFINPESTHFQVDFYGNGCRIAAQRFRLAIQDFYGNDFLSDYGANVDKVYKLMNLTNSQEGLNLGPDERGEYLPRYAARFSLFINNELLITYPSFDAIVDNVIFVP